MNKYEEELIQKGMADTVDGEILFAALLAHRDYEIHFPTEEQNKKEHWDVKAIKYGKTWKIDVKSIKEAIKNSNSYLLEVQNNYGYAGWLYGGMAGMAFEKEDHFAYVKVEDLRKIVKEKFTNWNYEKRVPIDPRKVIRRYVDCPALNLYKLCSRSYLTTIKRNDLFGYISYLDIMPYISRKYSKTLENEEVSSI